MTATVHDIADRREANAEAILREVPSSVLPDPAQLVGSTVFDCETSGLYFDAGHRVAAVAVAYRLDADTIHHHSFPFDQGRAADKGLTVQAYPDTPAFVKRGLAGKPKGDPDGRWDWDTDYNLPVDEWKALCLWLRDAGRVTGLSNHNLKFDIGMMRAGTRQCRGIELEPYAKWDTMLVNPPIWPRAGTNALKPIGELLWGEDEVAEAGVVAEALVEAKKRYGVTDKRYDLIPWEVNGPYASQDTVLAYRLGELQELMISQGVTSGQNANRLVEVMRVLTRMERRGFGPYDVERSRDIADRIDARIEELKAELPFSPPTGPAAARYFYEELGLAPWRVSEQPRVVVSEPDNRKTSRTPGAMRRVVKNDGDISATVSRRMADAGVPHAEAWAQITELTIVNKMFYRNYVNLAGPDDRIRTTFKQAFVRSGRLSVERFQAQALPKKLAMHLGDELLPEPRKLFPDPPGRKRMNLDLGQAELRIASLLAPCQVMLDALLTGADFHSQTTKRVFHIAENDPDWMLMRDIGKRLTFASIFQVGAKKFRETLWDQAGVEWSFGECKRAVDGWRNTYPEFGQAYYRWLRFAEENLYVPLVDGSPSWLASPRDYPNTAWNRRVQGSLALFANEWIVAVERATAKYDALVLTVHDSVVLDLPEEVADEVAAEVAAMTERMWERFFGIPGKCDVGPWQKS